MKKLFICETPYQIIIALILREQLVKEKDTADIIINNTFNSYLNFSKNLKKLKIFNKVYTAEMLYNNKLKKLKYVFNTKNYLKNNLQIYNLKYDELYFWNYDSFNASIRSALYSVNKNIKTYLFEEGYISYFPIEQVIEKSLLMKFVDIKNRLLHNIYLNNINGIYLFEPDLLLYNPNYNVFKLDRKIFYNLNFKNIIKKTFNVTEDIVKQYDKKYILFEEAMFSNSNYFDDEKIILDIVNKVEKENILIKLHPRTKEDRFSKLGIKTLGNDGIPWEAITLASNFSNKVFISISSSSIVNYRLTFGNEMTGILLFKFVNSKMKYLDKKYDSFWNKIKSMYPEKGLYIPNNEKELNYLLNNLLVNCIKK